MAETMQFWTKFLFKVLEISFKVIGWQLLVIALAYYADVLHLEYFTMFSKIVYWIYFAFIAFSNVTILLASRNFMGLKDDLPGFIVCGAIKISALGFFVFVMRHPDFGYVERLVDLLSKKPL